MFTIRLQKTGSRKYSVLSAHAYSVDHGDSSALVTLHDGLGDQTDQIEIGLGCDYDHAYITNMEGKTIDAVKIYHR